MDGSPFLLDSPLPLVYFLISILGSFLIFFSFYPAGVLIFSSFPLSLVWPYVFWRYLFFLFDVALYYSYLYSLMRCWV
jgi:hypothetical protein